MLKKVILFTICFLLIFSNFPVEAREIPDSKKIILFVPGLVGTELYEDKEKNDLVWFDFFEKSKINYENTLYEG